MVTRPGHSTKKCYEDLNLKMPKVIIMKYIDAERLREKITDRLDLFKELSSDTISPIRIDECKQIIDIIDSIQQDETQVDRMLCSQVWWEEQGWIMISPDATVEGIDSLLREVRKKIQQKQPDLPGIEESGIPGKDYIPVEWVDACEMYGKWKIVKQEQPEVDLDADIEMEWDSFNKHLAEYGGKSEEVVWLNRYNFNEIAHYFWNKGYNPRKEG